MFPLSLVSFVRSFVLSLFVLFVFVLITYFKLIFFIVYCLFHYSLSLLLVVVVVVVVVFALGLFGSSFLHVSPTCESKAACKSSKKRQNIGPTATGVC